MEQIPEKPRGIPEPEEKREAPGEETPTSEKSQQRNDEVPVLRESPESTPYGGLVYNLVLGVGGFICPIVLFFLLASAFGVPGFVVGFFLPPIAAVIYLVRGRPTWRPFAVGVLIEGVVLFLLVGGCLAGLSQI